MNFKLATFLIFSLPFSVFAADYSILSDTSRVGYYGSGEILSMFGRYGYTANNTCGDNILRAEEYFNGSDGWLLKNYTCMDIALYNTQKKNTEEQKRKDEEVQRLQNEIYKNTIADQNKKKDLEEYNKSIEEAKRVLEHKSQSGTTVTPTTSTPSSETKKLSVAGQRKATLLKKRIAQLEKQLAQLLKQLDEVK